MKVALILWKDGREIGRTDIEIPDKIMEDPKYGKADCISIQADLDLSYANLWIEEGMITKITT